MNTCMQSLYQNMNITSWEGNQTDMEMSQPGKIKILDVKSQLEFEQPHRNWYIWDTSTNRCEDHGVSMGRPHYQGAFTRIPEDAMVLRDCKLN